ncbi:MAG: FG-GAP repeat protein [Phycisphaerae bacterium]|jgi:hypothetical protein
MSRHDMIAIVLVLASRALGTAPVSRARAQCQRVKIIDSYGAPDDLFALSVEIQGDLVAMGAPLDDPRGSHSGSVATLLVSAPTVLHQLVRPGGEQNSHSRAGGNPGNTRHTGPPLSRG